MSGKNHKKENEKKQAKDNTSLLDDDKLRKVTKLSNLILLKWH